MPRPPPGILLLKCQPRSSGLGSQIRAAQFTGQPLEVTGSSYVAGFSPLLSTFAPEVIFASPRGSRQHSGKIGKLARSTHNGVVSARLIVALGSECLFPIFVLEIADSSELASVVGDKNRIVS